MRNQYYLALIKGFFKNSVNNYILRKNNFIGNNCKIHSSAILHGDIFIGNNVTIGPNVQLGKNVKIGDNTVLRNITIGDASHIDGNVVITGFGNGNITIGKECYIGMFSILDFSDNIQIGDFVHIAASTALWTHSSAKMCLSGISLKDKNKTTRPTAPIKIASNVYIGGNCTIYPGICLGDHVIITPNSAVNKDIKPFILAGGVPIKEIKTLD